MALSEEEVRHIALLARIGLKEEEISRYQKDLSAVFDFFRELEKVPTEDVEPIRHITGVVDVVREDVEKGFGPLGRETLLRNVPDLKDNFVKVRSVF